MSIERELLKNWTETTYQEPEVQLAAGPAETVTDTGPAFTMPGMGKRSQKSEVGQNLPVLAADAAAGAGTAGSLGGSFRGYEQQAEIRRCLRAERAHATGRDDRHLHPRPVARARRVDRQRQAGHASRADRLCRGRLL